MIRMGLSDLPQVIIRKPVQTQEFKKPSTFNTNRVIQQLGRNPRAINTERLEEMKLKENFKGFDPRNISSAELGVVGKTLLDLGLIDKLTASLLSNVGVEFDRFGVPKNLDQKMDALEYYAAQITHLNGSSHKGMAYARHVIPEYEHAVHVLQNLYDFSEHRLVFYRNPKNLGMKATA